MLTKELLEQIKLLGFTPKTFSTKWTFEGILGIGKKVYITEICEYTLAAEIQKWFKETFNLFCTAEPTIDSDDWSDVQYESVVYLLSSSYSNYVKEECLLFSTYEEALVDSFKEAIEVINDILNGDKSESISKSN